MFHGKFSLFVFTFFLLNLPFLFDLELSHICNFFLRIWLHFTLNFGQSQLVLPQIRLLVLLHKSFVLLFSLPFSLNLLADFQRNLRSKLLIVTSFVVPFHFDLLHLLLQVRLQVSLSSSFLKFGPFIVNFSLSQILVDYLAPHVVRLHFRDWGCTRFSQKSRNAVTRIYLRRFWWSRIFWHIESIIRMVPIETSGTSRPHRPRIVIIRHRSRFFTNLLGFEYGTPSSICSLLLMFGCLLHEHWLWIWRSGLFYGLLIASPLLMQLPLQRVYLLY